MKIAILVAGKSIYFPLFIDKPKSLYHLNGQIQLQRVIQDAKQFIEEEDIIVVGGYKYKQVKRFLDKNYPQIKFKVNKKYLEPAIYTFRKAIEGENDDIVFMFGDESISRENIGRICSSNRKAAVLVHDDFWYYSTGILKLRKDQIELFNDDKYLSMDAIKEIYCFANNKSVYDGDFNINSGICIGYIFLDLIRRISGIQKIDNPVLTYHGNDLDVIHFDAKEEYVPDLDHFSDTDEYKENTLLRWYSDYISDGLIRKTWRFIRSIILKWKNR